MNHEIYLNETPTMDHRFTSDQMANLIFKHFGASHKLWNPETEKLYCFDGSAKEWQFMTHDQPIPGMLRYPYVGYVVKDVRKKNNGPHYFLNAHNPFFPGKYYANCPLLDYPCMINIENKCQLYYIAELVEIDYFWAVRLLQNRQTDYHPLYTATPKDIIIPGVPIKTIIPSEYTEAMKRILGCDTIGDLLSEIRIKHIRNRRNSPVKFEVINSGGQDTLLAIISRDITLKLADDPDTVIEDRRNGTFLTWKSDFQMTASANVVWRLMFVVPTNVSPSENPILVEDIMDDQLVLSIQAISLNHIDPRYMSRNKEFLRLTTIHQQPFVPIEFMNRTEVVEQNLILGNIYSRGENADGLPKYWSLDPDFGKCNISMIPDPDDSSRSIAVIAKRPGEPVMSVLVTSAFSEPPKTNAVYRAEIVVKGVGSIEILSDTGELTRTIGILGNRYYMYSVPITFMTNNPKVKLRITFNPTSDTPVLIKSLHIYPETVTTSCVLPFGKSMSADYRKILEQIRDSGRNIDNVIQVGVFGSKGAMYDDNAHTIDWDTFEVTLKNLESPEETHTLVLKATRVFDDEYRNSKRDTLVRTIEGSPSINM